MTIFSISLKILIQSIYMNFVAASKLYTIWRKNIWYTTWHLVYDMLHGQPVYDAVAAHDPVIPSSAWVLHSLFEQNIYPHQTSCCPSCHHHTSSRIVLLALTFSWSKKNVCSFRTCSLIGSIPITRRRIFGTFVTYTKRSNCCSTTMWFRSCCIRASKRCISCPSSWALKNVSYYNTVSCVNDNSCLKSEWYSQRRNQYFCNEIIKMNDPAFY